jgi:DNA-binding transcriptional MerR regulator
MRIGELAERSGVSVQTVRYYERRGVLAPASRLTSGYRDYPAAAVGDVALVRWGQTLGFTLAEIAELLRLRHRPGRNRGSLVRHRAAAKRQEIDRKLRVLRQARRRLDALMQCHCEEGCPIVRRARRPRARSRRRS